MKKIVILLFVGVLCMESSTFSQHQLSAKEAVFIALENNYQIQIAKKQEEISAKNNNWSEAGLFPTVTLSVAQNNAIQDNTNNPFTFTPGIILSQSITPALNLNWNLFSGFAVKISKQRLEQLEAQSGSNSIAVIEATTQDVLKAYYTADLQLVRKNLFASILQISRDRMKYYELKEKYSSSTSLELLQFKNQYLTDSTNYLLQQISYDNAIRNLAILMNDTTLIKDGYELTDKIDLQINEMDFEEAKNEMLQNNQNLKNQYINLELQKTNTAFRKSFLYPVISFQAGMSPNWSTIREIQNNSFNAETNTISYYGNLNLQYTLFNNWKNKRAVEVSKIQEEIGQLNIESMQKTLESTLENLIDLYSVRAKLVDISLENLVYAQKAFELAEKRFKNGAINSIDLMTIQNNYENTMIRHYENLFNKMETYLEIYKMTGKIGLEYQK